MLEMIKHEFEKAKIMLDKHDYVRIYAHYDADGISGAAIVSIALMRMGKKVHVSFLKGLNESFEPEDLTIFVDMGSGYPEKISEIKEDVIIVDHHFPVGRIEKENLAHINPHLAGIDGSFEMSASATAYFFAEYLGNNYDLTALALIGIIGDKQKLRGGNLEVVKRGLERGYLERREGLKMISGKVREVLLYSTEPFLNFYGNEDELDKFLEEVSVDGEKEFDELGKEEESRLANGIAIRLLKMNCYPGIFEDVFGEKFYLKNELIKNSIMLSEVVNACGRKSANSIAFAICMRDESYLEKAVSLWREFQEELLEEVVKRIEEVKEGFCIRYLIMEDAPTTGPIASILSRYIFSDKPFIAINVKKSGEVKVSARGNEKLAEKVNLGEVMRKAAEKVGGSGGGHSVAAGANINSDKVEEFLKEVDRLCCSSLS
ncbi:phosphoesterase RecJ domain protein [Ferroglobus placidus DSM 10642]|uniref:Phosphoesterase RecJ domain protein n=1 Tax=Ferroglobus placidus (strain DSM 10642 / AEDII12DO) TaxID=589924 RepID=D3RZB1_FERPA|nr:DHH family phosphoesterase [Ferroglobus placidus]ADC65824.1 phosphoesterase RecJ domain protein [Ferroglobus placidus DSM 10642]